MRPDGDRVALYGLEERDPEYAEAPGVPGATLDTDDPNISLLLAILQRAILDLGGRGSDGSCHRHQASRFAVEAFEWVADDGDDVWGFVWVCDHLLLSVSATRQRLWVLATRMRHQTVAKGVLRAPEYRRPT